jgi:hypothetical protein
VMLCPSTVIANLFIPDYSCTAFVEVVAPKNEEARLLSGSRRTLFLLESFGCDPLPCLCALPSALQSGEQAHRYPRSARSSRVK